MSEKDLIEKITAEVVKRINEAGDAATAGGTATATGEAHANAAHTDATTRQETAPGPENLAVVDIPLVPTDVAKFVDHTLLKPEATAEQIDTLCTEAKEHHFYSVCVN